MTYEVTIAIPVYNVEKYIRQTMESVLSQTFASIEFLVCDDCGTDASMSVIEQLQQQHPRGCDIRILRQPRNMGMGEGRNRMFAEARSRYLYFMDADDTIEPDTIQRLYDSAQRYDADIVYGSYDRVSIRDGQTVGIVAFRYPDKVFTQPDTFADYAYSEGIQGMNWNYLIALDVVRRNNLRVAPVGHGYGEDFTFTIDLPTYITRAVLLSDVTYHYYIRGIDKHKIKKVLNRRDMTLAVQAVDEKKRRTQLSHKSYYPMRVAQLMMLDCSFACEMVGRRNDFDEPFTNSEVRNVMWHPMSLRDILASPLARKRNLLYWFIGSVPPWLCVWLLHPIIRRYRVNER